MVGPTASSRHFPFVLALFAMLFAVATEGMCADPDMFHEMALFREALQLGRLPLEDRFAYTPTVTPSIHHEWGTGAVLYFVATRFGSLGVLALAYGFGALILGLALACARRRGSSWPVLASVAPVSLVLLAVGTTTFRAQVFTLAATAGLLVSLEQDRAGGRRWIAPWLGLYVLWLNLHGGFVVGPVLLAAHALEQALRRQPYRHLVLVELAMLALVPLNPYGWRYYAYLGTALTMDRPLIAEWWPVWRAGLAPVVTFAFAVLVALYAVARCGLRGSHGILVLLATTCAAILHQRHVSLFGVAWLAYVPAWIQRTPLGTAIESFWQARPRLTWSVWGGATLVAVAVGISHRPARLPLPANPGEHPLLIYPVGAVQYLRESSFRGNLMVPFTVGAYVSWHLHPAVAVSIDGRYEVAYAPGVLERVHDFFRAGPQWREVLDAYPTQAVLAPAKAPIRTELEQIGWSVAYLDDAYAIHFPPSWSGSLVDRRGTRLQGSFP